MIPRQCLSGIIFLRELPFDLIVSPGRIWRGIFARFVWVLLLV